jgi:hypothetical protein
VLLRKTKANDVVETYQELLFVQLDLFKRAIGVKSAFDSSLEELPERRRGQACDLLFACFPFLPKPDMVDPERPHARRVQAGADRELGRSAFKHPTGVAGILGARGVFVLELRLRVGRSEGEESSQQKSPRSTAPRGPATEAVRCSVVHQKLLTWETLGQGVAIPVEVTMLWKLVVGLSGPETGRSSACGMGARSG